ncbi:MAG: 3-phosphoserine/phosphohydroxythreonine transaminase [Tenacibaculum sp.]
MNKHNFSAGPCTLPKEVLQKASEALINFNGSNLSIVEISHRSKAFIDILEKAKHLALELLGLQNKAYKVLFLQGGASSQFLMTAYNFLNKKAAYLNTGVWSSKAIKEASMFGDLLEVASSKNKNFNYIPKNYSVPPEVDYFHCTSNNTIYGTQLNSFPNTSVPLFCDMSSDIFSRQLNFSEFDLIYAGAQKNIGPAGITLVLIKETLLTRVERKIPSMLSYKLHIDKQSIFNTPAVFAIYVSMLNLKWLKNLGGISFIEKVNKQKSSLLYGEIDRNPLFKGLAKKEDRSCMNATFKLTEPTLTIKFDSMWQQANVYGLHGHRNLGHYRASMYNALPLYSVQLLVDIMQELEQKA